MVNNTLTIQILKYSIPEPSKLSAFILSPSGHIVFIGGKGIIIFIYSLNLRLLAWLPLRDCMKFEKIIR